MSTPPERHEPEATPQGLRSYVSPRFEQGIFRKALAAIVLALIVPLVWASPSSATWSVVGVDPETGEVGVAIASCVPAFALGDLESPLAPVVLVPGVGAGVTQAELNKAAGDEIERILLANLGAQDAIDAVVAPKFDSRSAARQHAAATLDGDVVAFTGADNSSVAGDRIAANGSAQGNILVSEQVLDDTIATFESTSGELATRLIAALQAGADAGGDSRCGEQTALFAQVAVAGRGDDPANPSVLLTFAVDEGTGENPVDALSNAWNNDQRSVTVDNSTLPTLVWLVLGLMVLAGFIALVAVVWFVRRRRGAL